MSYAFRDIKITERKGKGKGKIKEILYPAEAQRKDKSKNKGKIVSRRYLGHRGADTSGTGARRKDKSKKLGGK